MSSMTNLAGATRKLAPRRGSAFALLYSAVIRFCILALTFNPCCYLQWTSHRLSRGLESRAVRAPTVQSKDAECTNRSI